MRGQMWEVIKAKAGTVSDLMNYIYDTLGSLSFGRFFHW